MGIHQQTRIQAYQLRAGGARARLAILRMIAADSVRNANPSTRLQPGDWKGARHYTLKGYAAAFGMLDAGKQGNSPIWYSHAGPEFRGERFADAIVSRLPRGWYTDTEGRETARGIVSHLPHGRFIAGYLWSDNGERVYFPQVFDCEREAAIAADGHAEHFTESARADSERFDAMQLAELDVEEKTTELQKAIALRHRGKFGGFDRVRDCIAELKQARETRADAVRAYEKG